MSRLDPKGPFVAPMVEINKSAVSPWTKPVSAVNGDVHYRMVPVIKFADGVGANRKLRIASEFASLYAGYEVMLAAPEDFDPSNLPEEFEVWFFGPWKSENRPGNNGKLIRQNDSRVYKVAWQDLYDPAVTNEATLEFTQTFHMNGSTIIKVKLVEARAHGICDSSDFWLLVEDDLNGKPRKLRTALPAIWVEAGITKWDFRSNFVGGHLRSMLTFGKAWETLLKQHMQSGEVECAYWDCSHGNGYTNLASVKLYDVDPLPPIDKTPSGVFWKRPFTPKK